MNFDSIRWALRAAAAPPAAPRPLVVLDERQLQDAGLHTADARTLGALGIRRAAVPTLEAPFLCRRSVL